MIFDTSMAVSNTSWVTEWGVFFLALVLSEGGVGLGDMTTGSSFGVSVGHVTIFLLLHWLSAAVGITTLGCGPGAWGSRTSFLGSVPGI